MRTIFMVAEKPSLAQSLAQILSNGKMNSKKGFNGACSIHEYSGVFKGDSARFKMTSVCGHVMGLDFTGKYNSWDKVDPAELFFAPTEKKETTPKLHMPNFLHSEARNSDCLVLWLDCDKEGENICFEVIDAVKDSMKNFSMQNVYRAKFSAITDKDIKHAMNNLVAPNKNEASSVDARMELDLRIGCSFTRFQTKFFQGKYGNLDSTLISYGPCQTPTLGFCVERHDKIQSFKPEPYWVIQVQLTHPNGKALYPEWDRIRLFDKEIAQMFLNTVRAAKEAKVLSVSKKEKVKQRPLALNTVELMRVASSALGMAPHHAMQLAERLYTQGYISYPRTETTHYPENFDILGALRHQTSNSVWGTDVKNLLAEGIQRPRKGSDAGDHPPITPMKSASENELGGEAWRLYEFITKNFIATVSADCHYLQTSIKFEINTELFTCVGKTLISPGFTSVMTWQAISAEESLPEVNKGDICAVEEVKMVEKQTGPPDYLTESELITLMEKHGIGTDASIPVHINNICQRNYVTVESGRRLIPTPLGIVLVHGYQKIDPDLVLPTMRSAVEEQLNLIAIGKVNYWAVLQHTIEIFKLKFHYFVKSISNMDELFEVTFSPLSESGKPLSRCGKCRRFMKLIQAKPLRLHCSNCSATYSLPQNGSIKLHQELKCPLDDFELVLWSAGAKGKSYSLCPYCYSNPPFPDMRKGMGCNECTHPVCPHSLSSIGVCNCSECERGVIVLDALAKWKLACNKCNVVIDIFEDAHKVAVLEEVCEECNAQFMKVEYKLEKTKLPDNKTEYSGCIFCDKNLISLVQMHYGAAQHPMYRQRGGGNSGRGGRSSRSRGRGRGRGRGKGRGRPKDKMAQLAAYFV